MEATRAGAGASQAILSGAIRVSARHGLDLLLGAMSRKRRLRGVQLDVLANSASLLRGQRAPLGQLLSLLRETAVFSTLLAN